MACPILDLEATQNDKKAEANETIDQIKMADTTLNILSIIQKYGEDLGNPRFKDEVASVLEKFQTETSWDKLKRANDQVYKNTGLQRATKEYELAMKQHIKEQNATGNFQWQLGAVTTFLNKQFKSYTVALSLGRFINESSQAGLLAFTNKISQLSTSPFRKEKFASALWIAEEKLPTAGTITKESFATREFQPWEDIFTGKVNEEPGKILETLDRPAAKLRELGWRLLDKSVGKIEQFFYETEFNRFMGEYVNKNGKEASSFLWKENITPQNKATKEKLVQQWKREARESTKTAFFDYASNPLIMNKLETFIPFTNFMYNGIKLLNKYPMTFMFGAALLNNAQYAWGEEVHYVDDDGQAIDAGQSLRIPILASFGLDQVALNTNRMLQISPGSLGIKPLGVYNFMTGREDPRFKKFYKSGSFQDYADIGLSMVSPPIAKVVNALVNWDKNKDLEGKSQNSLADFNESFVYLTTGLVLGDKTNQFAHKLYFGKNYDALLELSPLQLNRFLKQDWVVKQGITEKSIKGLKKAQDLWILDFTNDPYERAVVTLAGLPMHDSIASQDQLSDDGEMIKNLAEVALGKKFIDKNYEDEFSVTLAKWKEMYKDKNYKDFEKAMPGMAKAITHFVENEKYYSARSEANKLMTSKDENERKEGNLRILALNYRFEWDENMNLFEKMSAIKSGKLSSPMFYWKNENGIPAHSVVMTDDYLSSLQYKGAAVAEYMQKTNSVWALYKARNVFWGLSFAANNKADKNKFANMANKMYNMAVDAEHDLKVTNSPEYSLWLLSGDHDKLEAAKEKSNGKNYSANTNWYKTFDKKSGQVKASSKADRDAAQKALISRLQNLKPQEVSFLQNVMKTDPTHRINSFQKIMSETEGSNAPSKQQGYLETLFSK